jgi:hypothetical protein
MNKVKFYILTSENLDRLKRHFSPEYTNLEPKKAVVVINTKCAEYEKAASSYCSEIGVDYFVTESNGTPARGKNIVLDLFKSSENDYMVHIDGDDYLTPHGVWVYDHLANTASPPDAVFLWRQKGLVRKWWEGEGESVETSDPFCIDFEDLLNGDQSHVTDYREAAREAGRDMGDIEYHIENSRTFWQFQHKYCEPLTQHCRLTFLSKSAAEIKFPEEVVVGEDTLHYFLLKDQQKEGKLKVFKNTEYPPTYIYDQTGAGTVVRESLGGQDTTWIVKFMDIAKTYVGKGIVHEAYELPELYVDYPEGYTPNLCGYDSGGVHFNVLDPVSNEINKVEYPANATHESVSLEYKRIHSTG